MELSYKKATIKQNVGGRSIYTDVFIPDLKAPEQKPIGVWGQRRWEYLKKNRRIKYNELVGMGTLNEHLAEVNAEAEIMLSNLIAGMKRNEGVTEELKADNQMEWVQRMNSIRNRAVEVVYNELIYV